MMMSPLHTEVKRLLLCDTPDTQEQKVTPLYRPFPKGSGVTAVCEERVPTGTPTPAVRLCPNPFASLFWQENCRNVLGIALATATNRIGVPQLCQDATDKDNSEEITVTKMPEDGTAQEHIVHGNSGLRFPNWWLHLLACVSLFNVWQV